jgi:putative endopeptidase
MLAAASLLFQARVAFAFAAASRPVTGAWGFDMAGIDPSVKPGDDFFRYCGGRWLATTEIPLSRAP